MKLRVNPNAESQAIWQQEKLEHLRYEYDLRPDDLVIDIGAYRGEWADQIYRLHKCKLILVEPTPHANGFPYGDVINKAAWISDGKLEFGGAYYYTSSLEDGDTEYECFDINDLLRQHDEIALVKINIEGAEYELMKHVITSGLHKRIKNLQIQFHEVDGAPFRDWYAEISRRLEDTHKLDWQYFMCWESWSRLQSA